MEAESVFYKIPSDSSGTKAWEALPPRGNHPCPGSTCGESIYWLGTGLFFSSQVIPMYHWR